MTKTQIDKIAQVAADLQDLIDTGIVPGIEIQPRVDDLLSVSHKIKQAFEELREDVLSREL